MVSSKFRTVECEHQHISYLFQRVIGHISSYPIGFIFGTDILQGIPWGYFFLFFGISNFFRVLRLRNIETSNVDLTHFHLSNYLQTLYKPSTEPVLGTNFLFSQISSYFWVMAPSTFWTVECEHQHTPYLFQTVIRHISNNSIAFIFGTHLLQVIYWN